MADPTIHLTQWSRLGAEDPLVVMVHGGAQGGEGGGDRTFSAQSTLAARGWRIIAPDRPGHGRSPSPGRPDDAEADGAWVSELMGTGGHLVGHSFGGCVALAAAASRPATVRSLTLIEPAMHALAGGDPKVQEFFKNMMAIYSGNPSAAEVATGFLKLVNVPAEMRAAASAEELTRIGEGLRRMKLPTPDQLRDWLGAVKTAGIPVLVVTGGWSGAFEATVDVVASLSGGSKVVAPSQHHLPQLTSGVFNERLDEFMRRADAGSARGSHP